MVLENRMDRATTVVRDELIAGGVAALTGTDFVGYALTKGAIEIATHDKELKLEYEPDVVYEVIETHTYEDNSNELAYLAGGILLAATGIGAPAVLGGMLLAGLSQPKRVTETKHYRPMRILTEPSLLPEHYSPLTHENSYLAEPYEYLIHPKVQDTTEPEVCSVELRNSIDTYVRKVYLDRDAMNFAYNS